MEFLAFNTDIVTQFFIKAFSIVLAIFLLGYGVIITRQVQSLNKLIIMKWEGLITFVSAAQIPIAIIILLLAIFVL